MTGACTLVQTPAGRMGPWSPETAETRGHGDTGTRERPLVIYFHRRVAASPHRRVIHLGLAEYPIHVFLQGALRHRPNYGIDHLAALKEE